MDVLLDQHHTDPRIGGSTLHREEPIDDDRRESDREFIGKYEGGLAGQGQAQRKHLLVEEGQVVWAWQSILSEPNHVYRFVPIGDLLRRN